MVRLSTGAALMVVVLLSASVWAAEPAASPPVLHLRFDEGGGAAAKDGSGNANDAVLKGTCKWVPGKVGKAVGFDGKEAYVEIPKLSGIDFDKSFTITAWVKSTAVGADQHRTVVSNVRQYNSRRGFAIFEETQVQRRINVYRLSKDEAAKNAGVETPCGGFFDKDVWVHMAVVADFERNKLLVFKNGRDVHVTVRANVKENEWNSTGVLRIGAERPGYKNPYFYQGAIDDLRIYQKALSEAEVKKLFGSAGP